MCTDVNENQNNHNNLIFEQTFNILYLKMLSEFDLRMNPWPQYLIHIDSNSLHKIAF